MSNIQRRPYSERTHARYVADQVKVMFILHRIDRQDAITQLNQVFSYSTVQIPD